MQTPYLAVRGILDIACYAVVGCLPLGEVAYNVSSLPGDPFIVGTPTESIHPGLFRAP